MKMMFLAVLAVVLLAGCGGEEFDQTAYSRDVRPLVREAVHGNIYQARLQEVRRGHVAVNIDFTQSPGDLFTARRAALGYCERLVSSIHENLDPVHPDLTFVSCRAGMNRGNMRDVYGVVRYGVNVGFQIKDS